MFGRKSQVSITEMISSALILIVAFSIFFSIQRYEDMWDDATLILFGRDFLLTAKNNKELSSFISNFSSLNQKIRSLSDLPIISWVETRNMIKPEILVGCNCTEEQISELEKWFKEVIINNRSVKVRFIYSNIHPINFLVDTLLIWGYQNLTDYKDEIKRFLKNDKGLIEISDFSEVDKGSEEIFGIGVESYSYTEISEDIFENPSSIHESIYQPFKYFFHVPLPVYANDTTISPHCGGATVPKGFFRIRNKEYAFWICSESLVWFDTNGDGTADLSVSPRERFELYDNGQIFNFTLSYIKNQTIFVSFDKGFKFVDFLEAKSNLTLKEPSAGRILLRAATDDTTEIPVVIVNSSLGRVVWISNFSKVGDDKRNLLLSSILFTSNKKMEARGRKAISIPFIVANNLDVFEVFLFNLKLRFIH